MEAREALEVTAIVGQEWDVVADGAGGDPKVVGFEDSIAALGSLGFRLRAGVGAADVDVDFNEEEAAYHLLQLLELARAPSLPPGPRIQLADGNETQRTLAAAKVRSGRFRHGTSRFEDVRKDVCINEDGH